MPNWCYNSMEISNPKVFKEKCVRDDEFTFDSVVPQPEHMLVYNELRLESDIVKEIKENIPENIDIKTAGKLPNELFMNRALDYLQVKPWLDAEEQRTGVEAQGWYEWNNANWGTKWDACQSSLDMDELEEAIANNDSYHFEFDTAWSPPIPVFEAMAKAGVEFSWSCSEEANFYAMEGEASEGEFSCWEVEIEEDEDDEDN